MTLFIVTKLTYKFRSANLNSKDEFKLITINFNAFLSDNSMMNKLIAVNLNSS